MTVIAIVPARGGSVGIPRKNLRPVGGVPLVGRTVAAALSAQRVDDVYVSTDDDAIARVAGSFGARVIRRPEHLAGPTASSESALLHALDVLEASGITPLQLVMLQCTSPFTTGVDVDRVVAALSSGRVQAAFSVVRDHGFLWRIDADGSARGINHDHARPRLRRQEMEPQYRETGAIYALDVAAFRATGTRFCGTVVAVPLETPALEIDEEADLAVADALAVVHALRDGPAVLATVGGPVPGERMQMARGPLP